MPSERSPTVALLLIGSELLSGKVRDTNGEYCIEGLAAAGARLVEIRVVHDEHDGIAAAVRELRTLADWLITSGGIGPTHDDITLAAIAAAMDRPVVTHPELQERVEQVFGDDEAKVRVWSRMARVPEGCTTIHDPSLFLPVYRVDDVFALPGVPQLFEKQFDVIRPLFVGRPTHTHVVYVTIGEGEIAEPLAEATELFTTVTFGSYPVWGNELFRTRITAESTDDEAAIDAVDWLVETLGDDVVHEVVRDERALKG